MAAYDVVKKEKLIRRIKNRLGWPKIEVELDRTQYLEAIHTALNRYSEFFPKVEAETMLLYEGTSVYTLETVDRIYGVMDFITQSDFLDLGLNFGEDVAWQLFGGTYGYSDSVAGVSKFTENYVTRLGTFEMAKNVFRTKKQCKLFRPPNQIIVLPKPSVSENAIVFISARKELSDLQWEDEDFIFNYVLAICKQTLGQIRSKFGDLPSPMGSITLNGTELKSEGKEEMVALEEKLGRMAKAAALEGYDPY